MEMAIVTRRQQHSSIRTRISKQLPFITMDIRANEEREGVQAMQRREGRVADAERGRMYRWRERKDVVLIMVLIAGVVLAMVLIETVLALLLMVLICPPVTCWRSRCCC